MMFSIWRLCSGHHKHYFKLGGGVNSQNKDCLLKYIINVLFTLKVQKNYHNLLMYKFKLCFCVIHKHEVIKKPTVMEHSSVIEK